MPPPPIARAAVRRLAACLAVLATPAIAAAQWTTLPNGETQYTATYSTSGSFRCWPWMDHLPGVACSTGANSLTLEKAGSAVTFTYFGFSGSQIVESYATRRLNLGDVTVDFTGPEPFAFPTNLRPDVNGLGWLDVTVHIPGPDGSMIARTVPYSTLPVGSSLSWRGCHIFYVGCTYGIPIEPDPRGFIRGLLILNPGTPPMPAVDGRYTITAAAAVVPEPATVALLGTGLLAVGGIAARRRKRAVPT